MAFVIPTLIYSINWAPKAWNLLLGKTLIQQLDIDSLQAAIQETDSNKRNENIKKWRENFVKKVIEDRLNRLRSG